MKIKFYEFINENVNDLIGGTAIMKDPVNSRAFYKGISLNDQIFRMFNVNKKDIEFGCSYCPRGWTVEIEKIKKIDDLIIFKPVDTDLYYNLKNFKVSKPKKRIFSVEDPYGEEDWG